LNRNIAASTTVTASHSSGKLTSRSSSARERRNSAPIRTAAAQRPGARMVRMSSARNTAAISSGGT
jgi:hypothetical protein